MQVNHASGCAAASTPPSQRSGLTIIEVLTVIVLLAILIALLLMALQGSRETAWRISCTNNLRQLIIAVENYSGVHQQYPGLATGNWSRQILPYIEQRNTEQAISDFLATPQPLQDVVYVPVYICPTDPDADQLRGYFPSYTMNAGSYFQATRECDGIHFGCDERYLEGGGEAVFDTISAGDVTDGLSQTAALSERLVWVGPGPWYEHEEYWIRAMMQTPFAFTEPDELDLFADACVHDGFMPGPGGGWHTHYRALGDPYGQDHNHVLPPNSNTCYNGDPGTHQAFSFAAISATSEHEGGVNLAMLDGSVKFASDQVDRDVWRTIGSRHGGEVAKIDF